MQYIDINLPKIIEARDIHYRFMRYIVKKKLNGSAFSESPPLSDMNQINKVGRIHLLNQDVIDYLNDDNNLKTILIGSPAELNRIKSNFTYKTQIEKQAQIETIKKIINYDSWRDISQDSTYQKYNAYNLAEKLDIPTCVYCNRVYTKTVVNEGKKKVIRPTFDHWFLKSEYPLLALSFFNLIPSCTVCNSGVKGSTPFSLCTHFHPYFKNPQKELKYTFSYDHKDYSKFTFKIITDDNDDFSRKSVDAFELESIFKAHEDEIEDMRKIKDAYSEDYIKMLENNILKGVTLDRHEVYRLAFGVHFQEAKFDRRPMSKMKKDILIELGIIKP